MQAEIKGLILSQVPKGRESKDALTPSSAGTLRG